MASPLSHFTVVRQSGALVGSLVNARHLGGAVRFSVLGLFAAGLLSACSSNPTVIRGGGGDAGNAGDGQSGAAGGVVIGEGGTSGSSGAAGGGGGGLVPPGCGNGRVDPGTSEECDDHNTDNDDGCSESCTLEEGFSCPIPGEPCVPTSTCGDRKVTGDERCDDGNQSNGDGCAANCLSVEEGWDCSRAGFACSPVCGDGLLRGNEECDFSHATVGCTACRIDSGYDCDATSCWTTTCGDGHIERGESCDDGNAFPFDGCFECRKDPQCENGVCVSTCGDGQRFVDEECDDGNLRNGDGCSSTCKKEQGWDCNDVTAEPPLTLSQPALLRDFIGTNNGVDATVTHIDFQGGGCTARALDTLDADGRPQLDVAHSSGCVTSAKSFSAWYTLDYPTDSTDPNVVKLDYPTAVGDYSQPPGKTWSYRRTASLTLDRQGTAGNYTYVYDSADTTVHQGMGWFDPWVTSRTFNGTTWDMTWEDWASAGMEKHWNVGGTSTCSSDPSGTLASRERNVSFTTETHFWFEYGGSESFIFSGDDDTWIFVNGQRVVDLGGRHSAETGSFTLDDSGIASYTDDRGTGTVDTGMEVGGVYDVVMFQAERNACGSNFKITLKNFNRPKSSCAPICGDGFVTAGELCDDGVNDGSYGSCTADCQGFGPSCGDATVQTDQGEQCDNGTNLDPYGTKDGCSPGCRTTPYCGDGVVQANEDCDPGDDPSCAANCLAGNVGCGNGIVEPGEECDDGDRIADSVCTGDCQFNIIIR